MSGFRRGVAPQQVASMAPRRKATASGVFEAGLLPDASKERLCRSLLAEFGITHVRTGGDGELVHGCLLPFGNHRDQQRNPTASLNYKKLTYNCLGCGAGGGLLWFIGTCRGETGERARQWLEDQTGTGADEQSLASLMQFFDAVYGPKQIVRPPMPRMDTKVLDPWLAIHPYLTEIRGIPEQTLMDHLVGFGTLRVRMGEGFVESQRIIIPHLWRGSLVGWQSRRLVSDGTPKYLSTPDFPKDRTLFSYDEQARSAVIVESPMSVLSKAHLEPQIEATFGAKITDEQIRLISMHPRVVLFFDNDESGWTATEHVGEALESYSQVWVADNPYNADAADLDDETYLRCVNDPVPFALWRRPTDLIEWDPDVGGG